MSPTKRRYESARQQKRQSSILAGARGLLEEHGYSGVTMRGLAQMAGVAPATLYNLYGSKDRLIITAVDEALAALGQRAIEADVEPGIDAVLAMTRLTAEQVQAAPKFAEAMTRALFNVENDDPLIEVLFARGYPFHLGHLEIAQRNGHVRPEVDVKIIAKHVVGNGWGQVLLWVMGIIELQETGREQMRCLLMTLISITRGHSRKGLEDELDNLGWANGGLRVGIHPV